MHGPGDRVILGGLRWAGRGIAMLLLLFWGAFFVEHLTEWFLGSGGRPPLHVWIGQACHLIMLIGLALMLRWDRLGSIVTALGTTAFFASIGYRGFPFIALMNLVPIACFAATCLMDRSGVSPTAPIPGGPAR
jgi:hypothetical protein